MLSFPALLLAVQFVSNDELSHNDLHWYTCSSEQVGYFLQKSKTEIEDVYLNYKNYHQRKDVNIETNSFNHKAKVMETGIMGSLFSK